MLIKITTFLAASGVIYLLIASALVASQSPVAVHPPERGGLSFAEAIEADISTLPGPLVYSARDGSTLNYRRYEPSEDGGRFLVLVHGSGWHGMQFHPMASAIAGAGLATVIVPDLRGHGASPARRGDVDHIGQLEEDLADLIGILKTENPRSEILLGGHSSGGGLVIRFFGGEYGPLADSALLLAPFLRHDAPTTKANSGGWAFPATRRIIGLTMFNMVGVRALNHLPVIAFAMPAQVLEGPLGDTATTVYTYRMLTGFSPRWNYQDDLSRLPASFLLLVGRDDEAFRADVYEAAMSPYAPGGTYRIVDGISHLGVVTRREAIDSVIGWMRARQE